MADEPKYKGPSAALIKALIASMKGKVGRPKDAYQGKLTGGPPPSWLMAQERMKNRMRQGPPPEWAEANKYQKRYLGGGGGGRVMPGGRPPGGYDPRSPGGGM